jgi:hypothetical protein
MLGQYSQLYKTLKIAWHSSCHNFHSQSSVNSSCPTHLATWACKNPLYMSYYYFAFLQLSFLHIPLPGLLVSISKGGDDHNEQVTQRLSDIHSSL